MFSGLFTFQRCLQGITEGKTKAPLSAKETLISLLFPECAKKMKLNNNNEKSTEEESRSLPMSVASALSLQSTAAKPIQSSLLKRTNDVAPDVSIPLSIQKSSFMPVLTSALASTSTLSSNVDSNIAGTLIFTNPTNTSTPLINPVTNTGIKPAMIAPPVLNIPTVNPMQLPISPQLAASLSKKMFLHMLPNSNGGVRYVLSPLQNSVPRLAVVTSPSNVGNRTVSPDVIDISSSLQRDQSYVKSNTMAGAIILPPPLSTMGAKLPIPQLKKQPETSSSMNLVLRPTPTTSAGSVSSNGVKNILASVIRKKVRKSPRLNACHFSLLHSGYTSMMCIFKYLGERDLLR